MTDTNDVCNGRYGNGLCNVLGSRFTAGTCRFQGFRTLHRRDVYTSSANHRRFARPPNGRVSSGTLWPIPPQVQRYPDLICVNPRPTFRSWAK
jgi:hypothetical protein